MVNGRVEYLQIEEKEEKEKNIEDRTFRPV
jgi:hypothetical protein